MTPVQRIILAFNKLNAEDFYKYIHDFGDVLLEEEEELLNTK